MFSVSAVDDVMDVAWHARKAKNVTADASKVLQLAVAGEIALAGHWIMPFVRALDSDRHTSIISTSLLRSFFIVS